MRERKDPGYRLWELPHLAPLQDPAFQRDIRTNPINGTHNKPSVSLYEEHLINYLRLSLVPSAVPGRLLTVDAKGELLEKGVVR